MNANDGVEFIDLSSYHKLLDIGGTSGIDAIPESLSDKINRLKIDKTSVKK